MKRLSVLLILILVSYYSSVAQDVIITKSGDELKGKIISFNPKEVVFLPKGINDSITLLREEVVKLQYQNGITINFSDENDTRSESGNTNDSLYNQGVSDATRYYRGYQGASVGTLVSAIVFPFNIIPAIACSATPPKDKNLGYRDTSLMEKPSYNKGYKKQAHKIKKNKVWKNYGIGTGAIIGLIIIVNAVNAL